MGAQTPGLSIHSLAPLLCRRYEYLFIRPYQNRGMESQLRSLATSTEFLLTHDLVAIVSQKEFWLLGGEDRYATYHNILSRADISSDDWTDFNEINLRNCRNLLCLRETDYFPFQ